jgi:predicted unusual protein kinase regulating ubiquinone biosynthesis (AarF/ABC1/UbiB family)
MNSPRLLLETIDRTAHEPRNEGEGTPDAFTRHLGDLALEHDRPEISVLADQLAAAATILNLAAPLHERAPLVAAAVAAGRERALYGAAALGVKLDVDTVLERSSGASERLVESLVNVATAYPNPPSKTGDAKRALFEVLGNTETREDRAVRALVVSDLIAPYVINRVLELDPRQPTKFASQVASVRTDAQNMLSLHHALAPTIDLALHGPEKSNYTQTEIAEKIFSIGPVHAKLGQSLAGLAGKAGDPELAALIEGIGSSLQEGIAPPDVVQQKRIEAELPEGLTYHNVISSASVAHIVETSTPEGEHLATKVLRPNITEAIDRNLDTYRILTDILGDYIEAHAGDSAFYTQVKTIRAALPFLLDVTATDIRRELELPDELTAQKHAREVFKDMPRITVPEPLDQYSDKDHITMRILEGQKIKDLPANPARLQNLMAFGLQALRKRFWHSNPHPGNLKSTENGDLSVYDWAEPIELSPRFVANFGRFVFALSRQKPHAIARAYMRIQSPDHNQATSEQAETVAHNLIQSLDGAKASRSLRKNKLIQGFVMAMGLTEQSTIDVRYKRLMTSAVEFAAVVKSELDKPLYHDRVYRGKVIAQSAFRAIKDVYFSKPHAK